MSQHIFYPELLSLFFEILHCEGGGNYKSSGEHYLFCACSASRTYLVSQKQLKGSKDLHGSGPLYRTWDTVWRVWNLLRSVICFELLAMTFLWKFNLLNRFCEQQHLVGYTVAHSVCWLCNIVVVPAVNQRQHQWRIQNQLANDAIGKYV